MRHLDVLVVLIVRYSLVNCADPSPSNQINEVNPDGSFKFSYQNNDQGAHFHQSSGHPAIKIRGNYGSRSPKSGKVERTNYTSGPRGYRARGDNIHRKQDLSQVTRGPRGSPTDPLADPYDDPSYGFGFKTRTQSRHEEADSNGRVRGEFIYVDDVGEKHGVKYTAGAHTGFEVENGVPDQPANIRYNTPLYKAEPTARGRITFERGPDRQYKFLTSSPDQRRAESTGPDGVTRGSYSYLDDKGVQRTVQYIAGAGIGYKVISSTVGPGTHIAANQDVPEYSIKAVSNEIAVADASPSSYPTGPGASSYPTSTQSAFSHDDVTPTSYHPSTSVFSSTTPYPPSQSVHYSHATPTHYPTSSPRPFVKPNEPIVVTTPSSLGGIDRNYPTSTISVLPSGGPSPLAPSGPTGSGEHVDLIYGLLPPKENEFYRPLQVHITPHPPKSSSIYVQSTPAPTPTYLPSAPEVQSGSPYGPQYNNHPTEHVFIPPSGSPPNHHNHNHIPSAQEYHDPAYKKPVHNTWYYGPQQSLRAHIQNIDLVPSHHRALSPSDALRLDELREQHAQHRQQNNHHPSYQHRL